MVTAQPRHRPDTDGAAGLRAEIARLRAELAAARFEKQVLETACHEDQLTGLLNRRGFLRDFERALSYARRYGAQAALLLLDLDGFKQINDRHGHEAGDAALREVAARLRGNLRASDGIGRLGGDEFAILLWQVDEATARTKACSLEAVLSATRLHHGGAELALAGSIGATALLPDDGVETALARADAAMYRRKAGRREDAR